jgi:hypothetical protein
MIDPVMLLLVAIAALTGAVTSAVLGWLDSGENFIARKFASSMIRAIFSGILFVIAFTPLPNPDLWSFIIELGTAFLGGAGIDVLGHRIAGAVTATTTTKTP